MSSQKKHRDFIDQYRIDFFFRVYVDDLISNGFPLRVIREAYNGRRVFQ